MQGGFFHDQQKNSANHRFGPGPITGGSTDPTYCDIALLANESFSHKVKSDYSVYVYPFEGSAEIGDRVLKMHQGGVLGSGDSVEIRDYQSGELTKVAA